MKRRESIPGWVLGLLLAGSACCLGAEDARLPPSTMHLLPQATLSGNFHTFPAARSFPERRRGTPGQLVWDIKRGDFAASDSNKAGYTFQGYAAGSVNANHGVVPEAEAAWWMAAWPRQIEANLIALTGTYHHVPQPNTAWKIEYRQNGSWVEHARGVGGWYDGGRYFWGGPGTASLRFDAIRVSIFSRDSTTPIRGINCRGEANYSWVVGQCAPIDAFIAPARQTRRAGRPETFAAQPLSGSKIISWKWDFGDGATANGANVSHTYANAGTYEVVLTFSDGNRTGTVRQPVEVGSPIDVRIVPLSGPVMVGQPMAFITQVAAGAPTQFRWQFGDDGTAEGAAVQHAFSKPGIYQVTVEASDGRRSGRSMAIVRAHTPETVRVPQVLLDADMGNEVDDQHYFAYALFSELDVLGVNSVHHGWENEPPNYAEVLNVLDLARQSGLPAGRVPGTYRGANRPLFRARTWDDTEPVATEASAAILAAARGASPENPVWIVPVGPATNVGSAILQARAEGLDLAGRVRIMWLGGGNDAANTGSWNGMRDPWSVYVIGQSGIETWIIPEPVGIRLSVRMATEGHLYPDNALGRYLYRIMPNPNNPNHQKVRGLYDPTTLAAIISERLGLGWFSQVERVEVGVPNETYHRWIQSDTGFVRVIRAIDPAAMKKDMFDTLNGSPTPLIDVRTPSDPRPSAGRAREG